MGQPLLLTDSRDALSLVLKCVWPRAHSPEASEFAGRVDHHHAVVAGVGSVMQRRVLFQCRSHGLARLGALDPVLKRNAATCSPAEGEGREKGISNQLHNTTAHESLRHEPHKSFRGEQAEFDAD